MIPDLCIGDSNTVLLEMPFCQWDNAMYDDVAALIQKQKLNVVLAHIERYDKFQKDKSIWNCAGGRISPRGEPPCDEKWYQRQCLQ